MKEAQFVNPEELKTIEHYGSALISSMLSLQTLNSFQVQAVRQGILDEDEEELVKTICWELKRLMGLYTNQLDNILERTPLDQQTVLQSLQSMTTPLKVSRKRKSKGE